MSTSPLRPCSHPHCGKLTREGKCPAHRGDTDRARGSARARGYTDEWAATARAWLERFPWCGQRRDGKLYGVHSACVQRGLRVRARVVDHIRSLREGGALLDPRNLQSLCNACNVRKK
jgi:5-methylcytosine-specific restriction protein A